MPARRELTMRQLRQMLRLARDGVSAREIGRTLGVARSTVQECVAGVWSVLPEASVARTEKVWPPAARPV